MPGNDPTKPSPTGLNGSSLADAIFRPHAIERMAARSVTEADIRAVLMQPETVHGVREGRVVAQRILPRSDSVGAGPYLLRVFIDIDRTPPEIVTAYWTSRVDKYRSKA